MKTPTNSKRILLTLSGRAYKMLAEIQDVIGIRSKSQIIRYALSLYYTIFKKTLEGYEVCLVKGDELRVIDSPEFLPSKEKK